MPKLFFTSEAAQHLIELHNDASKKKILKAVLKALGCVNQII